MSKAIVRVDIPTDYADEYKQWIIEGRLYYLEDGAWTFLKDVEYEVEPYREAIPIEWMYLWRLKNMDKCPADYMPFSDMLNDWEKENE